LPRDYKGEYSIKPFAKEVKKIEVNGSLFHCVIDQTPNNDMIRFTIYPDRTKTAHVLLSFSWSTNWKTNLCKPSACASLIKYALQNGWDFTKEKSVMTVDQGDFLIEHLRLDS
jgi:hypothetical protein